MRWLFGLGWVGRGVLWGRRSLGQSADDIGETALCRGGHRAGRRRPPPQNPYRRKRRVEGVGQACSAPGWHRHQHEPWKAPGDRRHSIARSWRRGADQDDAGPVAVRSQQTMPNSVMLAKCSVLLPPPLPSALVASLTACASDAPSKQTGVRIVEKRADLQRDDGAPSARPISARRQRRARRSRRAGEAFFRYTAWRRDRTRRRRCRRAEWHPL